MTLTNSNRWAASGAIAGAALVVFNPLTYWFSSTLAMGREYIAGNKGRCATYFGYFLHCIILFSCGVRSPLHLVGLRITVNHGDRNKM